jgi:hypothetical protein
MPAAAFGRDKQGPPTTVADRRGRPTGRCDQGRGRRLLPGNGEAVRQTGGLPRSRPTRTCLLNPTAASPDRGRPSGFRPDGRLRARNDRRPPHVEHPSRGSNVAKPATGPRSPACTGMPARGGAGVWGGVVRLTARMRVGAIFVGVALVLLVAHALVRGSGQVASAPNTRPAGPEQTSTPPPARGSARHQAAPPTPTLRQQPRPAAPQRAVQTRPIGWEGLMAGPVDVPAWPAGAGCRHEGVRLTEPPSRRGTLPSGARCRRSRSPATPPGGSSPSAK